MALDGDVAAQVLIAGAIDHAHAAADLVDDAVVRNRLADHGNAPVAAILAPARRQVNAER